MQSLKSITYPILVFLFFFLFPNLSAQTSLEGGDLAVVGVNANNFACSGLNGEDLISVVCFKDIATGTTIDITDNGWERLNANQFGDSEGTIRATYTGVTIPAGQVITFVANNSGSYSVITHTGWTFTSLNDPPGLFTSLNLNANGDQLYFMQGGFWDWGNPAAGTHDATYNGKILFGFNTKPNWDAFANDSNDSGLHPDVIPCFHMEPSSGQADYLKYTGPMTAATQVEWITLISNASNWTSYPFCSAYNSASPDYSGVVNFPIAPSGMSIACSTCTSNCPGFNETIIFNLPSSGGPFNVIYTDGTNNFTLNNINNGHVESFIVNQSVTYSLVSVTAVNGCPIYSNFEGEAMITISGSGGANAVMSGGGVLCENGCITVDVSITGGTPPYSVDAEINFPPFVNGFFVGDILFNSNSGIITICGTPPPPTLAFDPSTNTLTIPNVTSGSASIELVSIEDGSGCLGTVDPTPVVITGAATPSANNTALSECDQGNGTAIFDLTSVESTINGDPGNTILWYEDAAATIPINNPANYQSGATTVYAIVSNGSCSSQTASVQLTLSSGLSAFPASLSACSNSNSAFFDLTSVNNIVNGGTGNTVNWFVNSNGTNPINNPANYSSTSGTVYATVTNNGCSSIPVAINLTVSIAPAGVSTTMTVCESFTNPSFGDFDLTTVNNVVNGGTGLPVTWFTDASATNPIPGSFITAQNNTIVYAVVGTAPCASTAVPVTLLLTSFPPAVSTLIIECATLGNQAVFDLTSVDNIINAGSGAPVTWFEDIGGNNPIVLPSSYISASIFVYAYTSNAFCNSPIQPVELIVTPGLTANMTSATACDSGNGTATFDLTLIGLNVNSDPGNTVNWYFDSNATIPISSPYTTGTTNVYAQVTNGACESQIVTIGLAIDTAPLANNASATLCDTGNGAADFDLNVIALEVNSDPGNSVNWYSDANGNFPISSPYNSGSTTIYAEVTNGNCTSPITPVFLNVEAAPSANNASATLCDTGNGAADFDLNVIALEVNSDPGNSVNWYSDANGNFPISSPYNSGSTTIYAEVTNGNCTSPITPVFLNVEAAPSANNASATLCDTGNGAADFDLNVIALEVNSDPGNSVNWYSDANGNFPISSPYNSGSTTIYAEVTNGNCTSPITPVFLNVEAAPSANNASATLCDTGNGAADFDLNVIALEVNSDPGNSVNWYSDANGNFPISSPYNSGSTTIYAEVTNGNCTSPITPVFLNVEAAPLANNASATLCDTGNGAADFDLNVIALEVNSDPGNSVNWYSDANGNFPISSPYNSGSTVVYAVVSNGSCNSNTAEIILLVEATPLANAATSDACDIGNGTADFDLNAIASIVNTNSAYTVNWFLNANGTNPILGSPFNTPTTFVYAVVSDGGGCESVPTQVDLNVIPAPTANSTSLVECEILNGTADFDLTSLENIVNGGSGNSVLWYSDAAAINQIFSPYNSPTTTIYATVTAGICPSTPTSVDLIVGDQPTANTASASLCDSGDGTATFDLTALENTINGGTTDPVSFFSDAAGTVLISSPYNTASTTIYATVTVGSCPSEPVAINLMVGNSPTANPTSTSLCDEGGGIASFDLTALESIVGSGNIVTWYSDAATTNIISSPFSTSTTTVYAIVGDANCTSDPVAINLTVENLPTAISTITSLCDEGNGTASFDLTSLENTVNGGSGNTVWWYSDANATATITSPFLTSSTTIYAVVDNGNCLSNIAAIDLNVTTAPSILATSSTLCDEGGGMASFDLTGLESTVNGGSGNTVTWYSDASGTTTITSPFNSATTTIYAIVSDGNCNSPIEAIELTVANLPEANPTTITNCDSGNGTADFDLIAIANTVNGGNGNPVSWYSDINLTTSISSPFNSTATTIYAVVNDAICTAEAVEVTLEITNDISANPTTLAACDDGTGSASFDLTDLNFQNNITGGNGNSISWFVDAAATNPLSPPLNAFVTTPTSIYAVVGSGTCSSPPVEITLVLSPIVPSGNNFSLSSCDEGNGIGTFDLEAQAAMVNTGNGNQVVWAEDLGFTIQITPPFVSASTTIYAIVTDGTCFSEIVEVELEVNNPLIGNPTTVIQPATNACTADFDLDAIAAEVNSDITNTITWFSDVAATQQIMSPYNTPTTTVYAVVTNGNCQSQPVAVDLEVTNSTLAFPTSDVQCDDGTGMATFDLDVLANTVNGGNGLTVNWFSDAAATMPIGTPFTSAPTTIYAFVENGNCPSPIVEITLDVSNNLTAFPTTDSQCDDGSGTATFDLTTLENTVNGGNGNNVDWYSDAAATIPSPTTLTSGNTSVYAIVTDGTCASQIVEITLTVENNLTAFPTTDSQCDDGSGTATFDLTTLENTVNGGNGNNVDWYSDAAATIPSPTTLTSGNTSVYAIVTDGTCASQVVEITLTVENNLTAFPTTDSQCDDGSGTATFDLTTLENTVNGGNGNNVDWYSDAAATIPSPTTLTSGNTSVYAIVTDGTCASQIVEITLTVENNLTAFPTTDSQCDDGSGTATFDLTTLENTVNGGNGNNVDWYSDAAATIPSPTTLTSGNTSVYAIVTDGTCASQIVEITLTVENNLTAFPTTDSQCDDGSGTATFDLTTLENTVNGGNGNNVDWYSDAAATIPSPTTLTSGNTSVYAIVTDGTCASQIVEITLTVENNLTAFPTTDSQCDDGSGTATFDLTTLENTVNGGNGNNVDWYSDAAATIPSPTTLTSGNTSVYAIVTDGTCASQIVEITLTVENNLTAFPTTDSQCDDGSGTATFDLTTLENTVNGGNGNNVDWYSDAAATIPSPTTLTSGNTSVYAIVTDGTCASQIVEITLTVENNLTAFPTTDSQCDDGSGTATFDLTTLENTVNGGNGNNVDWYSDAAATIPSPTTLTSGNTSVYAIVTDGTCASQIVEITLTVENNLTAFPTTDSQCDDGSGTATFDLTTLENTVNGGNGFTVNWYSNAAATTSIPTILTTDNTSVYAVVTDGNCFSQAVEVDLTVTSNSVNEIIQTLCDGESLLVNNVVYNELNAVGTETISGGNINGCDSIINIDLTFEPEITGTISASTNLTCPGNDVTLTFNLTGGTTYDVEFFEGGNPPTILNGISDGYTITVTPNTTTTYSLESVVPLNTTCTAVIPNTQVTIQVEALDLIVISIASVGGYDIVCANGNTGAAVVAPTNGIAPFTYLWSNGQTTDIASSLSAGNYEVTVTDANGCSGVSSITLTEPNLVEFDVTGVAPPCLDAVNGQIILENITGGIGSNYTYSFDGGPFINVTSDTTVFDFVSVGEHTVFILDEVGCGFEQTIIVPEPVELTLELGDNQTIELGESFEIQPQTNFVTSNILWSENVACDTCFTQVVTPVNQTTYTLELFDENGCFVTDEITILVEKNRNVFIPNAFSPDDNGFNDIFYINAGEDVEEVKNFRIFNRWGEVVFENENFQPNEPTEGWDGFFNGEKLNPSVLVFFAEVEFKDGVVKIYKGDVTLTR